LLEGRVWRLHGAKRALLAAQVAAVRQFEGCQERLAARQKVILQDVGGMPGTAGAGNNFHVFIVAPARKQMPFCHCGGSVGISETTAKRLFFVWLSALE